MLCRSLVKACRGLTVLAMNTDAYTSQAMLEGLREEQLDSDGSCGWPCFLHLRLPGRCRRPLSGVSAARLSGQLCVHWGVPKHAFLFASSSVDTMYSSRPMTSMPNFIAILSVLVSPASES